MSEKKRKAPKLGWAILTLTVLLMAYVASVGPAYLVWQETGRSAKLENAIHTFYAPILWTAERFPEFRMAMKRYIDFWLYTVGDPDS